MWCQLRHLPLWIQMFGYPNTCFGKQIVLHAMPHYVHKKQQQKLNSLAKQTLTAHSVPRNHAALGSQSWKVSEEEVWGQMSWKETLGWKRHSGVALTLLRRSEPCRGDDGGTEQLTARAQSGLLGPTCCPYSELSCFPGPELGAVNKVRSHVAVCPDIKPISCRSPKCPLGQVNTAPGLGFALVGGWERGHPEHGKSLM